VIAEAVMVAAGPVADELTADGLAPLLAARSTSKASADEFTPLLGDRVSTKAPDGGGGAAGDGPGAGGSLDGHAATAMIFLIGVAASSLTLEELASQYFLKDSMGLGPAEVAVVLSFHSFGWIVKPLWGMISDSFPIGGQRRKPYALLVSSIGAAAFFSYGGVTTVSQFILTSLITNCCMAFLTVIAQAMLVQRSADKDMNGASRNFTSYFAVKTTAGGVLALTAGYLLERYAARSVLMAPAIPFILLLLTTTCLQEAPTSNMVCPTEQLALVAATIQRQEIWGTSLYLLALCVVPSPAAAMFFFNVDVLKFDSVFMSMIVCVTALAGIAGLGVYHYLLTDVPFRKLFFVATVLCSLVSLTPLIQIFRLNRAWGIDDRVFAIVDTFVIFAVIEVLWMPVLVLASRLCPPSVGGTMYAFFLSIHNLGLWGSQALGGALMHVLGITRDNLEHLWILVVICAMTMLAPLALLHLVPRSDPELLRREDRGNPQTPP